MEGWGEPEDGTGNYYTVVGTTSTTSRGRLIDSPHDACQTQQQRFDDEALLDTAGDRDNSNYIKLIPENTAKMAICDNASFQTHLYYKLFSSIA